MSESLFILGGFVLGCGAASLVWWSLTTDYRGEIAALRDYLRKADNRAVTAETKVAALTDAERSRFVVRKCEPMPGNRYRVTTYSEKYGEVTNIITEP